MVQQKEKDRRKEHASERLHARKRQAGRDSDRHELTAALLLPPPSEAAVLLEAHPVLAREAAHVVSLRLQMEALVSALPYAEIALSILLIVGVVLQQRGATLGGAFGGDNFASTFYKRRGAEKFLFNATIVFAVLLVLAALANFLLTGA